MLERMIFKLVAFLLYILLALIVAPCELQAESNTSISLNKKESYFTLDGKQTFLLRP